MRILYATRYVAIAGLSLALLAGCQPNRPSTSGLPSGDVAAMVGDRAVTLADLDAEAGVGPDADAQTRRQAELGVLDKVVAREALAQEAIARGVQRLPEFRALRRRALDLALVDLLEKQAARNAPLITSQEVESFVARHPELFSNRELYLVDEVMIQTPRNPAALSALEPLKTLDEVQSQLDRSHIAYQRSVARLDPLGFPPGFAKSLSISPLGDVMVVPNGRQLVLLTVQERSAAPLTGLAASEAARRYLGAARRQAILEALFDAAVRTRIPETHLNPAFKSPAMALPPHSRSDGA